jgi:poly-gamma-glutamate capsule biosynthesis protein CapA/YwtB (metallophosphatase superfamily)
MRRRSLFRVAGVTFVCLLAGAAARPWAQGGRGGGAQEPPRREAPRGQITAPFSVAGVGDALVTQRFSMIDDARFLDTIKLIRQSDVAFANLEMLFHEFQGSPASESSGTWMGADPAIAEDLKWAGFDLLGRANNHAGDYGEYGMRRTTEVLDGVGLVHAGIGRNLGEARRPAYLDTPKGRVALVSCTSTFVAPSRAAHPRPDVPGRPGASTIRNQRIYRIEQASVADLARVATALGMPEPRPSREGTFNFLGSRFKVSETNGVDWTADERDTKEILDAVREARRMADFVIVNIHSHEPSNSSLEPAQFLPLFARAAVDAGADAFFGSGPHRLRGVEIYKGRPIFYSLGDFFFQNDAVKRLPSDFFEQFDLPWSATVADAFDARDNSPRAFSTTQANFESAVALSQYDGGKLTGVTLYPLTLGYEEPRSHRGRPRIASAADGQRLIKEIADMSAKFGTKIDYRNGVGVVDLASSKSTATDGASRKNPRH